jgi:hypothetical protein
LDEGSPSASYTINCSKSVVWNWTVLTGSVPSSTVANGGSGTSIKFSLSAGSVQKSCNVQVTSGGKTWDIGLVADPLGGA